MKRYLCLILCGIATLAGTALLLHSQIPATFLPAGIVIGQAGPPGGAMTLLEQHTASSSASLNFTTCLSSTYDTYQIFLDQLLPATNTANVLLRVSTNGGSSYDSGSHYDWLRLTADNASSAAAGANATTSILVGVAVDTTTSWTLN